MMNRHVFGLAWTGQMTRDRLLLLARHLPEGVSELYFHPAAGHNAYMAALMPGYDHEGELAALLDPEVRAALQSAARLRGWAT